MSGYRDLPVRRTIAKRSFPKGTVVITPMGRMAKVIGHGDDGRVELHYIDGDERTDNGVRLASHLLQRE